MTPIEFSKERNALVAVLKKAIKPFLYESGYIKGFGGDNKRPLKLWVPRDAKGKVTNKAYTLLNGFVIAEFEGFTEDGVIIDAFGHGLVTKDWPAIPIEDLYRLSNWVERMLPKLTAYDQLQKKQAKASRNTAASQLVTAAA